MNKLKQYLGYIIAFLVSIIGFLAFLITRKNKELDELEADVDLADQRKDSAVVDQKVDSAQQEIDKISQEMKKPVDDKFWDDYFKDKK